MCNSCGCKQEPPAPYTEEEVARWQGREPRTGSDEETGSDEDEQCIKGKKEWWQKSDRELLKEESEEE